MSHSASARKSKTSPRFGRSTGQVRTRVARFRAFRWMRENPKSGFSSMSPGFGFCKVIFAQPLMDDDAQHLKLLSIFHYVVAGITAFVGCFPIIHLTIGIAILSGRLAPQPHDAAGAAAMGWLFTVIAGGVIAMMWSLAIVIFFAGRFLQQRRRRMFCLV